MREGFGFCAPSDGKKAKTCLRLAIIVFLLMRFFMQIEPYKRSKSTIVNLWMQLLLL